MALFSSNLNVHHQHPSNYPDRPGLFSRSKERQTDRQTPRTTTPSTDGPSFLPSSSPGEGAGLGDGTNAGPGVAVIAGAGEDTADAVEDEAGGCEGGEEDRGTVEDDVDDVGCKVGVGDTGGGESTGGSVETSAGGGVSTGEGVGTTAGLLVLPATGEGVAVG